MSDISVEPWLSDLISEVNAISTEKLLRLNSLIHNLGVDESTKEEWISVIREQVAEGYAEIIDDALSIQTKLSDNIEALLNRSSQLCKLLQIEIPQYGSENLSLCEEQEMLKKNVDELENMVTAKEQKIDTLRKRQLEVCKRLGREQKLIKDCPLPSTQELDEFAEYIDALELEALERKVRFARLKGKIVEIAIKLGIKPTVPNEKKILSPDDATVIITDSYMKWVEEYYISLQNQLKDIKREIQNLRDDVSDLWKILSEDIQLYNEFSQTHASTCIDALEAWKREWKRCKELKKVNIEMVVKELRRDISALWEKCRLTNSQRADFESFHSTIFTEDLVTLHEMEVKKLQKYYEDNK